MRNIEMRFAVKRCVLIPTKLTSIIKINPKVNNFAYSCNVDL